MRIWEFAFSSASKKRQGPHISSGTLRTEIAYDIENLGITEKGKINEKLDLGRLGT